MKHDGTLWLIPPWLLLSVAMSSCAWAQSQNPCKNPEFGYAEEGFKNCKPQDAFARLQELAKQNDPKALYMLGIIYDGGGDDFGLPDIKPNGDLAMKYLVQSANEGYAEAQSLIALYYWRGYHETRKKEAIYWWCRAAAQNDQEAIVNIQMQISAAGKKQAVQQYCVPILKSPPPEKNPTGKRPGL